MRAIHAELKSYLKKGETVDNSVVKHCFDAWLDERHSSAERNLFPGAVEMLTSVSALHPYACIGAITNGRGSPISMSSISHFFDFCVSGEDDNVFPHRKPQRGIYEVSLQKYTERYPQPISEDHIWCHVGDCLANDIGGSSKCGAYAIWMDMDHEGSSALSGKQPTWSTASKRTIRNRQRLAKSAKDNVSAKITKLSELPSAIEVILEKAAQTKQKFVR
jgi:FMN phosphatase YigB (HAD superfamily)